MKKNLFIALIALLMLVTICVSLGFAENKNNTKNDDLFSVLREKEAVLKKINHYFFQKELVREREARIAALYRLSDCYLLFDEQKEDTCVTTSSFNDDIPLQEMLNKKEFYLAKLLSESYLTLMITELIKNEFFSNEEVLSLLDIEKNKLAELKAALVKLK